MKIKAKGIKFNKAIADMQIGEKGYTVPWAYDPITNELDINYDVDPSPLGTCEMKVTRTIDGYDVELPSKSMYRYSKYYCPPKF